MEIFTRLFELATFLGGIAILTLLIGNAGKTAQVVSSVGSAFNDVLKTITLQAGY